MIFDSAYVVAAVLLAALALYLLGGGADFGGGVWDLLAMGKGASKERAAIERAIGPIWEANHVWLIFVFTVYFAAFPPAFAYTVTAFFSPLTVYAIGVVLRGAAFTFRHYDPEGTHRKVWTPVFAVASVVCPFLLGAMGAAMLRKAPLGAALFDAFTILGGLFAVALLAALAAVYLTVAASEPEVVLAFRKKALGALVISGALALSAIVASASVAPDFTARVWGSPLWIGSALLGVIAAGLVYTRQYRVARITTVALVVLVVLGWGASKGDTLVITESGRWTVQSAKAHEGTLRTLLASIALGALALVPSLALLYRVFGYSKGESSATREHP